MTRIKSLDGIRTACILLVFSGHLYGTTAWPIHSAFKIWIKYAHLGVQIFFVLSGFLITTLLLKEHRNTGRIDLRAFYRRRTFRIFPAAFLYITIVAFFIPSLGSLVYAYTYTMCYASQSRPWLLGHMWSLSVEEQFYLLWPFVIALAFRWRFQVAILTILLEPAIRILLWKAGYHAVDEYFPAVADSLAAGCLLACIRPALQKYTRVLTNSWVFLGLSLTVLITPLIDFRVRTELVFGGLIPLLVALCIFIAIEREDWILNNPVTARIGVLSYSLYLWQQPFLNRNIHSWWTAFPTNLILTAIVAWASYAFVEQPFLRLKNKPIPLIPPGDIVIVEPEVTPFLWGEGQT